MEPGPPPSFDWTLVAVSAPFAAALLAIWLARLSVPFTALLLLALAVLEFYFFAVLLPPLAVGGVIFGGGRLDALGFGLTYAIDSLSVLFLLTLHFAFAMACLAVVTAPSKASCDRTLAPLMLLAASAQAVVLADSLDALVLSVALLAAATGWTAATCRTGGSGRTAFLAAAAPPAVAAAILLLTAAVLSAATAGFADGPVGSMTAAINAAALFRDMGMHRPLMAAFVLAVAVWSVQLPVAARLLSAPVSGPAAALVFGPAALLPVYLLMRVHPFLGDNPAWSLAVPPAGAVAIVVGGIMALRGRAPLAILGWMAFVSFGALVMMVGTSLNQPLFAALVMVPAHGFAVAAMVLSAGFGRPFAGRVSRSLCLIAMLVLAGAPLTLGYLARGVLYDGLWDAAFPDILGEPTPYAWLLQAYTLAVLVLLFAANVIIALSVLRLLLQPAPGDEGDRKPFDHAAPLTLLAAVLALGFAGAWVSRMLFDPARYGVNFVPYRVDPPAFSGAALWLTVLGFAVAGLLFRFWIWPQRTMRPVEPTR